MRFNFTSGLVYNPGSIIMLKLQAGEKHKVTAILKIKANDENVYYYVE